MKMEHEYLGSMSSEQAETHIPKESQKVFSGEYVRWLSQFTQKFSKVERKMLTTEIEISEEDRKNIINLVILYEIVAYYAEQHGFHSLIKRDIVLENGKVFEHNDYVFFYQTEEMLQREYYYISLNHGKIGNVFCGRVDKNTYAVDAINVQEAIKYEKSITS